MHADRIYVLEKGKIVEEGNHDTLLINKGLIMPCGDSR
jgi:ATP-binding cassette subfamily B protein